jgi:GNAT superfamily N-acetyltransferase
LYEEDYCDKIKLKMGGSIMITYLTPQLTRPSVTKIFGLYIAFFSIVIAMDASPSEVPEEKEHIAINRITANIPGLDLPLLSGSGIVSTAFSGPYYRVDEIHRENIEDLLRNVPDLATRVQQWAKETCRENPITRISVNVPNGLIDSIEELLKAAGFSRKSLTYCLSKEAALNSLQKQEISTENIHTILSLDSPFLSQTAALYGEFNKAMKVPGLFYACVTNLLAKGGKIYVHYNPQTSAIDGLISHSDCFLNKHGQESITVDGLFVNPDARKKGIARKLIKYALNEAFEGGTEMIYWETGTGRIDAQGFYKKHSLEPDGFEYRYKSPNEVFARHFAGQILQNMLRSFGIR